jgi:hypothetical protein
MLVIPVGRRGGGLEGGGGRIPFHGTNAYRTERNPGPAVVAATLLSTLPFAFHGDKTYFLLHTLHAFL